MKEYQGTQPLHNQNLCSKCKNSVWLTTKNSSFPNSGSMQDYLKFLMANAEDVGHARSRYRCYCKILHEYQDFAWFDDGYEPHIITFCDDFIEYEEDVNNHT